MSENPTSESASDESTEWLLQRRLHFDELIGGVEDYAIFMMTRAGIILDWNTGAESLKGYRADEIVGKHFSRFYAEKEILANIPDEELEVAAAHGKFSTEGWRFRKNGSRFWASITISAIRTPEGKVAGFVKITRDLTERQEANEALRQSEERFRLLIESVVDYAIFMLDQNGNIVSWNEGARRIKGYESDEIIGLHFSRFYTAEALEAGLPGKLLAKALEQGSAEDHGWRVKKSGERFWGSVLITAVRDEEGEHRGFVKITRDLTERKRSEMAAEANQRKDTFLATLAHELRNPLAPMLPGIEIILKMPHDTGRVIQIASMIRRQIGQMSHLIEDLVDLSRITTGRIRLRRERAALTEIIEASLDTVRPLIDEKGHQITLTLPPFLVEVDADKHRLTQAFTNLLVNAAKYSPRGAEINVSAEIQKAGVLQFRVRDNGMGLSNEDVGRVFELFEQGKQGSTDGLGIGLTLVRTIAEMHGGAASAASPGANKGSTFTLELPIVVRAEGVDPLLPPDVPPARPDRCQALVVDDSKSNADTLALLLEMEGFKTSVAYDGRKAVEVAREIKPEIICLDIGMPVMDGYQAAAEIRKALPGALIIAITGWGADEDKLRSHQAGFDCHLLKPVRIEDLTCIIHERLPACFKKCPAGA